MIADACVGFVDAAAVGAACHRGALVAGGAQPAVVAPVELSSGFNLNKELWLCT